MTGLYCTSNLSKYQGSSKHWPFLWDWCCLPIVYVYLCVQKMGKWEGTKKGRRLFASGEPRWTCWHVGMPVETCWTCWPVATVECSESLLLRRFFSHVTFLWGSWNLVRSEALFKLVMLVVESSGTQLQMFRKNNRNVVMQRSFVLIFLVHHLDVNSICIMLFLLQWKYTVHPRVSESFF